MVRNKKITLGLLLFILFVITGCQEKRIHNIQFYHWKANISIGQVKQEFVTNLGSNKLYLHLFDIDLLGDKLYPKAMIKAFDSSILNTEYIPVVFIANRALVDKKYEDIEMLAQNTFELVHEILFENGIVNYNEIQIDCDWTESTKELYFYYLTKLKEVTDKNISSTIRLHQIKFKDSTGIPPVDKGYLMCYATTNPAEDISKNSILDITLLKDYTANINEYPLPFDIALPLYSWAIVTNHIGEVKLINNASHAELDKEQFKKINSTTYEVLDDCFFHNLYLNKGFTIKLEEITPSLLKEAKEYLDFKVKTEYDIVYYHLDKDILERYKIEDLK